MKEEDMYDKSGWGDHFRLKHLDSKADMVTLRMNERDRQTLNQLKRIFRCDMDSTVVKKCVEYVYGHVVHSPGTRSFFGWLSESRRVRPGPKVKP